MTDETATAGLLSQLFDEPRLADAGVPSHAQCESRPILYHAIQYAEKLPQFDLAADERASLRAGAAQAGHPPQADGLVESFDRHVAQRLRVECTRNRTPDGVGDKRLAGLCHRVKPGGEVNRIAGNRVLWMCARHDRRGHHLAAGYAYVQRQRQTGRIGNGGGFFMHVDRCARRSFAVVAVRDGSAERCQRGIAGVVDHLATVVCDDAIRNVVELA